MHWATRWQLLAVGVAAYALALLAMAPATLVSVGMADASDGRLRIAEIQGTLWSGTGQLEILDATGLAGFATHIGWHLRPHALLFGKLDYEVKIDAGPQPFQVGISWSRITLENADISLPAAVLGLGVARLAPLGLAGEVRVNVPTLSIGPTTTYGSATLLWRDAGSALSPVSPLGNYELRVEGEGARTRVTLHTLQGPLTLDGEGTWAINDRAFAFLATAYVPPEFHPRLAPFLRLIGVERSDGSFDLRFK